MATQKFKVENGKAIVETENFEMTKEQVLQTIAQYQSKDASIQKQIDTLKTQQANYKVTLDSAIAVAKKLKYIE